MSKLSTNHMGIELKNPLILGASNLVTNIENLKKAEKAGVAAIVYKSLFEEQIQLEDYEMHLQMEAFDNIHSEMLNLFPNLEHAGPKEYLYNLRKAKESISVPLIASINAVYKESWVEYAKQIEETGVDGLEMNFFAVPRDASKSGHEIIEQQLQLLKSVKEAVNLPVSVKMSPFYTNILKTATDLGTAGADALILFNRMFEPDIDIQEEKHVSPWNLSSPGDYRLALRHIGLLYNNTNATLCANNGIYEGTDIAKMILAGANCVQVVSTIYHNGIKHVTKMLSDLEEWMDNKGYNSIDDFKGKLSRQATNDPFVYKRAQYIEMILKSEDHFKPVI